MVVPVPEKLPFAAVYEGDVPDGPAELDDAATGEPSVDEVEDMLPAGRLEEDDEKVPPRGALKTL